MRKFFDDIKTEFFVTGLVLLNMLMLLVDMVVTDDQGRCNIYGNATVIRSCIEAVIRSHSVAVDAIFSSCSSSSSSRSSPARSCCGCTRTGSSYLMDVLNAFDAFIVSLLFILQILLWPLQSDSNSSILLLPAHRAAGAAGAPLRGDEQGAEGARAYKKAKYMKLGSPVERVMELLGDMKSKIEEADDVGRHRVDHAPDRERQAVHDRHPLGGRRQPISGDGVVAREQHGDEKGHGQARRRRRRQPPPARARRRCGLKRAETKVNMGDASRAAARRLTRLDEVLMMPEMEYYLSAQPGRSHIHLHDWDVDLFDFAAKCKGSHLVVGV